jgi:hypothetical protein
MASNIILSSSESLQIRDFYIHLNNGQHINYNIDNINELDNIIRIYGRTIIYSITFYFYDNKHQFHNLIIKNINNDRFIVEFFHYYNSQSIRFELNRDQQYNDFTNVMNVLYSTQNLQSLFIPYIINPFETI